MGFSDSQRRALTRKLAKRSVRSRTLSGATLRYVSGWHDALSVKRQAASKLGRPLQEFLDKDLALRLSRYEGHPGPTKPLGRV
jgi:hypothetical protein